MTDHTKNWEQVRDAGGLFFDSERRAAQCREKLGRCMRLAQEHDESLRRTGGRKYLELREEALADAKYWQTELEATTDLSLDRT